MAPDYEDRAANQRCFEGLVYGAKSRCKERRAVAKLEVSEADTNSRFVVSNVPVERFAEQRLEDPL